MAKTGRGSFQQMLRLTEDLKEKIAEAAEANGRSMNAEIVSRLETSFAPSGGARQEVLYVLLDADGHPTSWPELMMHLSQLAAGSGFDPAVVQGQIFNADLKRSSERDDEWFDLVQHYRSLRGLSPIVLEDDE